MLPRRKLAALLLPLLLLTGCWDRREIEERSNVLASGIDTCESAGGRGGDHVGNRGDTCKVIVTRQIAIPGRIPLGGGSEGGGGKGETVVVFSTPGKDAIDSAAKAQAELNRTVSFAHTRVLLFSEAYARRGLEHYLDYVRRVPEVRRLMWVTVSEGSARDVIRSRPSLERVPALFLSDMLEDAVKAGRLPDIYLGEFLARISNKGEETIAPMVRMVGLDHPALAGLAVFRGNQMVGKLDVDEMHTYMQLRGFRKGAENIRFPLPGGMSGYARVYERKATYRLRENQGRITCRIKIELESELAQLSPRLSGADPQTLASMERSAEQEVVRRSGALLKRLQQELQADVLGVGERVRGYLPAVWKRIPDWPSAFSKVEFQVEARVHVRRTGMGTD